VTAPTRRMVLAGLAAVGPAGLAGCLSIGSAGDAPAHRHLRLHDAAAAGVTPRERPLLPALLIQAQPADALADTTAIAYSRAPQSFAFYQHASWTERPVRLLPRLLQQRLQARRVADAVGLAGDPLRADWLLALRIDTVHHDVAVEPGRARLALDAELFDRRRRTRVALRRFAADAPVAEASSVAAAEAMAQAVALCFDALVPWLEAALLNALAVPVSAAPGTR
jgi:ABC-type uncharacterized transport system auxiliary subunit